ncbi:MAG: class I SAM-dependent methyltransferase [Actinobacteria bacterium]|nr:class I SAM-dependent methyltransferase [Actinomycetota bacterium]
MAAVAREPPSRPEHARRLFAGIAGEYDRMGAVLSFGQDPRWRRFLVSRVPESARLVLDVATGTGLVAGELAGRGGATVVGVDLTPEMLLAGRHPGPVAVGRAERLPFPDGRFDALTVTYLLRYVDDPPAALRELARVVRAGGVVASLEFHVPGNPLVRTAWRAYTRAGLPLLGALVSRAWAGTGRFLGPSVEDFYRRYPLAEQGAWWRAAGLREVRHRVMSLGGGTVIWGVKDG